MSRNKTAVGKQMNHYQELKLGVQCMIFTFKVQWNYFVISFVNFETNNLSTSTEVFAHP